MIAASDPNMLIAKLAIGGLMVGLFWRFIVWVRESPTKPDPWDAETEKKLSDEETPQPCHHCSTPLSSVAWFCPHCGSAVGPYNNMMPYVMIFSEGEVYRNGVNQRFRNRPLIVTGYLLITILFFPAVSPFFAPIYIIVLLCYGVRLFKNLLGSQKTDGN
jgi:hypothetical protein